MPSKRKTNKIVTKLARIWKHIKENVITISDDDFVDFGQEEKQWTVIELLDNPEFIVEYGLYEEVAEKLDWWKEFHVYLQVCSQETVLNGKFIDYYQQWTILTDFLYEQVPDDFD